ncbi:MAG TPA: MBL fold metallo-hydrolase [Flavisolibacter sp.]|nr:MBL fold metallo-hydrolase [Flavisolibacter sp.]
MVILIDTGKDYHLKAILLELMPILERYGKKGPDLILCTHYDFDHIGSLDKIVERFHLHTKNFWMHKTHQLIRIAERLEPLLDGSGLFLPDEDAEILHVQQGGIIDYADDDIQDLLQNLFHEKEVLRMMERLGIDPVEPIYNRCSLEGWPEIKVLGPTLEYYNELFPEHFDWGGYLESEKSELTTRKETDVPEGATAFERLDNWIRSALTATNRNSAIVLIETVQGKFLFAADAGIESFQRIPDYKTVLTDVHFLKVPHHGSANNLNTELIQLMNPDIAFISGKKHLSPLVVDALRLQGTTVLTTLEEGRTLQYPLSPKE